MAGNDPAIAWGSSGTVARQGLEPRLRVHDMPMLKLARPTLGGCAALSLLATWLLAVSPTVTARAEAPGTAEPRESTHEGDAAQHKLAEDIARDASRLFDRVLESREGAQEARRRPWSVAQSQSQSHRTIESGSDWLARARRDYNSVIERLSEPTVPNPVVDAGQRQKAERDALWRRSGADAARTTVIEGGKGGDGPAPRRAMPSEGEKAQSAEAAAKPSGGAADVEQGEDKAASRSEGNALLGWLNRAYRRYERDVIGALSRSTVPSPAVIAASRDPVKDGAPQRPASTAPSVASDSAPGAKSASDLARQADAAGKSEDVRKADEALRVAEKRRTEETARLEQEKRLEEARRAEMARKAEVERKKEQTRLVEADASEAQRKAEAERKAAERKAAEEKRVAAAREAEERKAEAERKAAERKVAEEAKAAAAREAEAQRKAEAERKAAERKAAEERKVAASREAEAERKAAAEAQRKAAAERKAAEEAKAAAARQAENQRKAEAERKAAEEAKATAAARAAEARQKDEARGKAVEAKAAEYARRAKEAAEQATAERARLAAAAPQQAPSTEHPQPAPATGGDRAATVQGEGAKPKDDAREAAKARRVAEAMRRQAEAARLAEQRARTEAERAAAAAKGVEDAHRAIEKAATAAERRRALRLAAAEADKAAIAARRAIAAAARIKAAAATRPVASVPAPTTVKADAPATADRPTVAPSAVAGQQKGTACDAAGRNIALPGWYVVGEGDSLWKISAVHYKDGKRYRRIVRANAGRIDHPGHIVPCQRIYLP